MMINKYNNSNFDLFQTKLDLNFSCANIVTLFHQRQQYDTEYLIGQHHDHLIQRKRRRERKRERKWREKMRKEQECKRIYLSCSLVVPSILWSICIWICENSNFLLFQITCYILVDLIFLFLCSHHFKFIFLYSSCFLSFSMNWRAKEKNLRRKAKKRFELINWKFNFKNSAHEWQATLWLPIKSTFGRVSFKHFIV